jgi:hypothetical protein
MLQSKGGAGKTFSCLQLAQYLRSKGKRPIIIDTDPVNSYLEGFNDLAVEELATVERSKHGGIRIIERSFDKLIERVISEDADIIIDTGASNFVAVMAFMVENDGFGVLIRAGRKVVVHTVVGGEAMAIDTMAGMNLVGANLRDPLVEWLIWVNPFFGELKNAHGDTFEQLETYRSLKTKISAVIYMPKQDSDTFKEDLNELLGLQMTYAEAIEDLRFGIMARQRFAMMQREMFEAIDAVYGVVAVEPAPAFA